MKAKCKFLTFAVAFISIVNCCHATPNVVGSQAIQSSGNPSAGTSLNLPTGCQLYLYGLATGGGNTAGLLSQGQSIYVNNADGYTSVELAASTNNSNSFTTSTSYHVFGGCGVSNINYVQGFYGTNSGPAATNTSVTFTVTNSAVVVVLGVASSQTALTLSGISNLVTDVPVQTDTPGTEALIIAHGNVTAGTYTIQEATASGISGQDPNHQVDLIGVLIFSDYPSVATSGYPQISLPTITNTNSGSGNVGSGNSGFGQWQPIGPSAIPQSSGPPGAGKLQAFAVDFANPQVMYAGGGAGPGNSGPYGESGIFRTIDGGNTWTNVNTGLTDPMVDVLWLDQTNPNIVLAGTWFVGIFRSTDTGAHWMLQTNLGSTTAFLQVGQTLYAATASGIAESTDTGVTWSVIEPTSAPVRALAASGTALYAGLDDGRVLYQTSPSSSWQTILSEPSHTVWSLAADPTSTQTVYVVEWDNYQADLFVTTNSGGSWTPLFPPGYNNAAQVVAIDSSGAVYAGFDGQLDVSVNQGATWATVSGEHWDTRFLLPWPGQSGKLVVGSDQGLYMTGNGGSSWVGLNDHITSSLLTGFAVSGSTILTAVQDYSPIASFDGGANWQQFWGSAPPVGEDGIMRFNPSNPNYAYAYTSAGFWYSTDGGNSFNSVPAIQFTFAGGHNLISVDPMNPSMVYVVANNGIFRSSNWGVSWASLSWSFTNPSLIVVSPNDSQTIFVGTQGSGLYVTHNGGTTWTPCNLGGAAGYPYALDIDPGNTNVVYVGMTLAPNGGGGVWISTNGGSTFVSDNSGLNSAAAALAGNYVWTLSFNRNSTNGMAALATANGVYLSASPGAPWTDVSGNAIPKLFTDLTWVGGDLYAATYGEGVIRLADAGLPFFSIGSPPLNASGFSLVLHGLVGADYAIQASTDLINWQTTTNFTSTTSLMYFSDPAATNYRQRFYRALIQ